MNQRTILISGVLFAGLGVALGAFGAHALKPMLLANNKTDIYETAVRYQVFHALALLLAGVLINSHTKNTKFISRAAGCWIAGILLFSGSLFALCFSSLHIVAILTPVGGVLFLTGWAMLGWAVYQNK